MHCCKGVPHPLDSVKEALKWNFEAAVLASAFTSPWFRGVPGLAMRRESVDPVAVGIVMCVRSLE